MEHVLLNLTVGMLIKTNSRINRHTEVRSCSMITPSHRVDRFDHVGRLAPTPNVDCIDFVGVDYYCPLIKPRRDKLQQSPYEDTKRCDT